MTKTAMLINALIAAEPDSVFTAEWAITFARAVELGLTRRHESDWYGGFGLLLDEANVTAAQAQFGFDYDPLSDRVSRLIGVGEFAMGDPIDVAGQDVIEGAAGNDVIRLGATQLLATAGATNAGLTLNGAAFDGQATDIAVAATVEFPGSDLIIKIQTFEGYDAEGRRIESWDAATGDRIIVKDWFDESRRIEWLRFSNGEALRIGDFTTFQKGTNGNDVLVGTQGNDFQYGGDGEDKLFGLDGDDFGMGGAPAANDNHNIITEAA